MLVKSGLNLNGGIADQREWHGKSSVYSQQPSRLQRSRQTARKPPNLRWYCRMLQTLAFYMRNKRLVIYDRQVLVERVELRSATLMSAGWHLCNRFFVFFIIEVIIKNTKNRVKCRKNSRKPNFWPWSECLLILRC